MIAIDTAELDELAAELRADVDASIDQVAGDAIRDQAAAALRAVRGQARRHRKSGAMESRIVADVQGAGADTVAHVTAGGPIAPIIVRGQRSHEIRAHAGGVLAFGSSPARFAPAVMHPGVGPDPFVRRGLAAAAGELDAITADAAADLAADVAARLEV